MTDTEREDTATAEDPRPATPGDDPAAEHRAFLEDMDRVVAGELPFGVVFGLDADDIHAFADLADDLLAAGRVAEALFLYTGCVQLDPMDATLLCGLATTLRHAGDADNARRVSALALELEPDNQEMREFLTGAHLTPTAPGAM